jgi:hypothetical protein
MRVKRPEMKQFPHNSSYDPQTSDVPGLPNFIGARSHLSDFARVCLTCFLHATSSPLPYPTLPPSPQPSLPPPLYQRPAAFTRRDAKVRFTTKCTCIKAVLCLTTSTGRESTKGFLLTKYEIGRG